jgi:TPR repeat protein
MKNSILILVFTFIFINSFAQEPEGKEEYDKVIKGWGNNSMSTNKGFKLLTSACEKGYNPACKRLMSTSSTNQDYTTGLCADRGDLECMYKFAFGSSSNLQEMNQKAKDFLLRSAEAKYEPSMLLLAYYYENEGTPDKLMPIYQSLADIGNKEGVYKLAILKKDAKAAFEVIKDIKEDPFIIDPLASGEAIYKSAKLGDDPKFAMEVAKIYNEKAAKFSGISHEFYEGKADALFIRACELGNGEGCYQRGLDYLSDYRDHTNGLVWFEKAIKFGFKVPEAELLKMSSPPSSEDIKIVDQKLQKEIDQSIKWAKSHPNEDEIEYKENTANNKTKPSLSKADMDKIINSNSQTQSQEAEAKRHQLEMDKQAGDAEKIKNGTWNGH